MQGFIQAEEKRVSGCQWELIPPWPDALVFQESTMLTDVISRHEKDWDLLLLKQELKNLEREQLHLTQKQNERSLTDWEIKRATQILDEVMGILSKLSSHKFTKNPDQSASA